ncbi:pyridoxal phosphate biosynthetic protein PdxA [Isoalcanivorax pacificus W11-5]|uniref:4-hydroxythreonine-4-phosphate dehydrogenase n=1 Tax=Isoalcanivorax pacificus W11-5 TaxID=391936 RepID=A0A0B4XQB1_9GAMM|nr:4-hydroxythreonine-4-phosphate dehydrogenase PdxA [Isoalcanivorax pacificus]AJD49396.1 pyridoxal phosphate biosynthetic protein PdxA [Isoalcanivorax pacificus W11-5]
MRAPIAVTSGDPAGIGPDLVLTLSQAQPGAPLVVLGDHDVLGERARQLKLNVRLHDWTPGQALPTDALPVWHCPAGVPVIAGRADPATAAGTLAMLDRAIDGCLDRTFAGMVTAPLAKSVICDGADPAFTGHTEYLAARSGTPRVVMMLATDTLRVALATTHLPLRAVADALQPAMLAETLRILDTDLRQRFSLPYPRILVLGLNPHAGESGHLGREELDVIIPTLTALRAEGLHLTGPMPADTAFTPRHLQDHDAVLAMYHDQGLPVLKYAGFGQAVNITLGLPFIRTSVDHGTAFDLAGSGRADHGSLLAATRLALSLAQG